MTSRTNDIWLDDLRSTGASHEEALGDLSAIIQKGLPYALSRWLSSDDPLFQPLVEEVTQETLLRVLDQLDTFEGRSLFTTWVHKIAIRDLADLNASIFLRSERRNFNLGVMN